MGKKQGGKTLSSKVEEIKSIDVPTKVFDICRFVGLFKYYRDVRRNCVNTLTPLKIYAPLK